MPWERFIVSGHWHIGTLALSTMRQNDNCPIPPPPAPSFRHSLDTISISYTQDSILYLYLIHTTIPHVSILSIFKEGGSSSKRKGGMDGRMWSELDMVGCGEYVNGSSGGRGLTCPLGWGILSLALCRIGIFANSLMFLVVF